ncbi:hypothetical protein E2C01_076626 [Portunus trituberculatus]|uniref:Uncharacterized protein n=1 Tax=Portunus trituberculatus TaxID=210409 RepID=A0A5B7IP20_PORTR|nr:hypothetical protein [Portunus trituberculatus]
MVQEWWSCEEEEEEKEEEEGGTEGDVISTFSASFNMGSPGP